MTITVEIERPKPPQGLVAILLRRLDLPPDSDADAIRTGYRELVKVHHPDAGGDADEFRSIHAAYLKLKDLGVA